MAEPAAPGRGEEVGYEVLAGATGEAESAAERRYGGRLSFPREPRPYVIANFVTSIDGVASLGIADGTDSSTLSGRSGADRFLMAMLRAAAGAVMIGAGNLRATPGHQWTPAAVAGEHWAEIADYRTSVHGSSQPPPLVVVSGTGQLPAHVALDQPATRVLVATGGAGADRVRAAHPRVEVIEAGESEALNTGQILDAVSGALGAALLLCEGGPSLLGQLQAAGAVDELFLTVSPVLAGRDRDHRRPGLVEGWAATPDSLRPAALESVRRHGEHLFLRYQMDS